MAFLFDSSLTAPSLDLRSVVIGEVVFFPNFVRTCSILLDVMKSVPGTVATGSRFRQALLCSHPRPLTTAPRTDFIAHTAKSSSSEQDSGRTTEACRHIISALVHSLLQTGQEEETVERQQREEDNA